MVLAFEIFRTLKTQWRCGPAGFYGLDYSGVKSALELMRSPKAEWPDLFDDLRDLETGALAAMAQHRSENMHD